MPTPQDCLVFPAAGGRRDDRSQGSRGRPNSSCLGIYDLLTIDIRDLGISHIQACRVRHCRVSTPPREGVNPKPRRVELSSLIQS